MVVSGNDLLEDSAQLPDFNRAELREILQVAAAAKQNLKRPHRPEGNHGHESRISADYARLLALLHVYIIAEEAALVLGLVSALRCKLPRWCLRDGRCCPYLAMRMRIARAHHFATIFENLHVPHARHF